MKLQLYTNEQEEKLIRDGCALAGLNLSCFLRTASILYARKLVRENNEVVENATN
jgi:hypothetical protein